MSDTFELTAEQSRAKDDVLAWRKKRRGTLFSLSGAAGTGKTTLVRELAEHFPRAAFTATTGRAALRLSQAACVDATTLHSILYYPPEPGQDVRFERRRPPECSTLVIDESSMTTPRVYEDLLAWAREGVSILLVGDPYQLPPVVSDREERAKWGEDFSVFSHVGGAVLETVMRSAGGVLRAATRTREKEKICRESDASDGVGYVYEESRRPLEDACAMWLGDKDDHYLVTWRNSARMEANHLIRRELGLGGELPDPGEPVLVRKNAMGFLNGEVVECGGWESGPALGGVATMWMSVSGRGRLLVALNVSDTGEVVFDGQMPEVGDWKAYWTAIKRECLPIPVPATFGYCLTCHAAQGGEARRATVFLERGDERSQNFTKPTVLPNGREMPFSVRFVYTAVSRARERSTLIVGA